jgi:hypothetical protein
MAIFEIKNYTRYNTEDLLALFEAAESELRGKGLSPQRAARNMYTRVPDPIDPTVTFKDYGPSDPYTVTKRWDPQASRYASSSVRKYIKGVAAYKSDGDIRIIPPGKIYTNALKALAATSGSEVIPAAMMEALAARVVSLYMNPVTTSGGVNAEVAVRLLLAGMTVRIMPRRAAAVDTAEKVRVARAAARKTWRGTNHSLEKTRQYTEAFLSEHRSAMNRLKRSRVTLTAEEADLEAAIQEFINAGDVVKGLLKKVVS